MDVHVSTVCIFIWAMNYVHFFTSACVFDLARQLCTLLRPAVLHNQHGGP